jgi:hypothetical protein
VQKFYQGLTMASRTIIDASTGGSITSRDVVINDITLTSLKTPEWSQLVFCDDFVLVTMVASHLCICDEISFFVIDVSLIRDEIVVVMEMNSIYDERRWSWI